MIMSPSTAPSTVAPERPVEMGQFSRAAALAPETRGFDDRLAPARTAP